MLHLDYNTMGAGEMVNPIVALRRNLSMTTKTKRRIRLNGCLYKTSKKARLYRGNILEIADHLPSHSVHTIITSIPYWMLREYGEETGCKWPDGWYGQLGMEPDPQMFVRHVVLIFRKLYRVLRNDGTLWLNIGDTYSQGYIGRTDSHRRNKHGVFTNGHHMPGSTGGNARVRRAPKGYKPKCAMFIPHRIAIAMQDDGWYSRSEIVWAKCLSGGTSLYVKSPKGEAPMTIKDLSRLPLEKCQLWNGNKWSNIINLEEMPRPKRPLEIELRSGETIGCSQEHRWPTQRGLIQASDIKIGDIIETCRLPEPCNPKEPEYLDDTHHNTKSRSEVIGLRHSSARKFWDIEIADKPHLFSLSSGVLTHNSNPMPECGLDRPVRSHEFIFLFSKKPRYFYDREAIRVVTGKEASWDDYEKALGTNTGADSDRYGKGYRKKSKALTHPNGHNKRDVWNIQAKGYPGAHFATFPVEIPKICILAGTSERGVCRQCGAPLVRVMSKAKGGTIGKSWHDHSADKTEGNVIEGGQVLYDTYVPGKTLGWEKSCNCKTKKVKPAVVFDPFSGAATAGVVALQLGRRYIGVDAKKEYLDLSWKRLQEECPDEF